MENIWSGFGKKVNDRLSCIGRHENILIVTLESLRSREEKIAFSLCRHADKKITRLAGKHVRHLKRNRLARERKNVHRPIHEERVTIDWFYADKVPLTNIGGGMPRKVAHEGHKIVPLRK